MSGNNLLTTENTIFYSSANSGYAIYAAVSLLSIRKYLPDAKLCILSSGLSDYDRKILEKNSIDYHELDLSHIFTKNWDYPIDCYYIFAGPEIFRNRGYMYSVYVDGDTLCESDPLEGVGKVASVAGAGSSSVDGKYISIFGNDWDKIKSTWNLSDSLSKRARINAGVVYFNNNKMQSMKLLEKVSDIFKKSLANNIPRKGDDSLFSLFQFVHLNENDIKILSPRYNYVLQFNEDRKYPIENLVFFHFSIDKPWKKNPYSHDDKSLDRFNPYVKKWRHYFRIAAWKVWFLDSVNTTSLLAKNITQLTAHYTKISRVSYDQYLYFRGLKSSLYKRKVNSRKQPLKVYWWRSKKLVMKNFGDEITSDIIYKLFGYKSERTETDECEMVGAGSILDIVAARGTDNTIKVWGSGYIEESTDTVTDGLVFYAVRGEYTRSRISQEVTLGDPGLLANLVYPNAKYKSAKIGVVIHYADMDLPIVNRIRFDQRFIIIDPLDKPGNVARAISACKLVLSSSLHGLIFADSYSVPNVHIKLSDRLAGGIYKFKDYYSSIDKDYNAADVEKIFNDDYLTKLESSYERIKQLPAIQRNLVKAFPYER